MTVVKDDIRLHNVVLLETNYYYELLSNEPNVRHAQCMLLFGNQTSNDIISLQKSIVIPLTLNCLDSRRANFQYDAVQLQRRIDLICETNTELIPCGVMVVYDGLYDYADVIQRLYDEHQLIIFLTYDPSADADLEDHLKAFKINQDNAALNFRRINLQLGGIDVAVGNDPEPSTEEPLAENQDSCLEESAFVQQLIKRIDGMLKYLDSSEQSSAEVLRKISLLTAQIRKEATKDIDQEIMNKESEIDALNIIFEQWEMSSVS